MRNLKSIFLLQILFFSPLAGEKLNIEEVQLDAHQNLISLSFGGHISFQGGMYDLAFTRFFGEPLTGFPSIGVKVNTTVGNYWSTETEKQGLSFPIKLTTNFYQFGISPILHMKPTIRTWYLALPITYWQTETTVVEDVDEPKKGNSASGNAIFNGFTVGFEVGNIKPIGTNLNLLFGAGFFYTKSQTINYTQTIQGVQSAAQITIPAWQIGFSWRLFIGLGYAF